MDEGQIDQILKAIDDSQRELMDKMNDKLTQYAPLDKLEQALADLDGLTKRTQNLERSNALVNEKLEETGKKLDNTKKATSRNSNDIDKLKLALKQGMKTLQSQPTFTESAPVNIDEESDDNGVSNDELQDVISQIQRMEKTFMQRITELEKSSSKFVQLQDRITELQDNMVRALAPRGPTISEDDVNKWNQNIDKTK